MITSRFLLRLLINAAALWVATRSVPGVSYTEGWVPFFGVALIFGVVNASVGKLAKLLTLPLIIVTLGVFLLVVNALMLWLTSALAGALKLGFHVDGFGAAFWGSLVVSLVSVFLTMTLADKRAVKTSVRSYRISD